MGVFVGLAVWVEVAVELGVREGVAVELGTRVWVGAGVREGVTVAVGMRVLVIVGVTGVRVGVTSETALVAASEIQAGSATSGFKSIRAL